MKNKLLYAIRGAIAGLVLGIIALLILDGMEECVTFGNQLSCVWLWNNVTVYREDGLTLITNMLPLFVFGPMLLGAIIGWMYGKIKNR